LTQSTRKMLRGVTTGASGHYQVVHTCKFVEKFNFTLLKFNCVQLRLNSSLT
jgi:hypothetical protein